MIDEADSAGRSATTRRAYFYRQRAKLPGDQRARARGYTLVDLLAVGFVASATALPGMLATRAYGSGAGIAAAFLGFMASSAIVVFIYRWLWRRERLELQFLRDKYQSIYRVLSLPTDPRKVKKPDGAEIRVGDYGWEARPMAEDGLIYLQGLTLEWTLVWYAGFRPDQVERVSAKPVSQYDRWRPYWTDPAKRPPCPFPVEERETQTVGVPHYSHRFLYAPSMYPRNKIAGPASKSPH